MILFHGFDYYRFHKLSYFSHCKKKHWALSQSFQANCIFPNSIKFFVRLKQNRAKELWLMNSMDGSQNQAMKERKKEKSATKKIVHMQRGTKAILWKESTTVWINKQHQTNKVGSFCVACYQHVRTCLLFDFCAAKMFVADCALLCVFLVWRDSFNRRLSSIRYFSINPTETIPLITNTNC